MLPSVKPLPQIIQVSIYYWTPAKTASRFPSSTRAPCLAMTLSGRLTVVGCPAARSASADRTKFHSLRRVGELRTRLSIVSVPLPTGSWVSAIIPCGPSHCLVVPLFVSPTSSERGHTLGTTRIDNAQMERARQEHRRRFVNSVDQRPHVHTQSRAPGERFPKGRVILCLEVWTRGRGTLGRTHHGSFSLVL